MEKNNKIVILLYGFTREEASKALAYYFESNGNSNNIIAAPVTEEMEEWETGKAVEKISEGKWPGGKVNTGAEKCVIIGNADQDTVVKIMRAFKASLLSASGNQDAAFAMITKTAEKWTLKEYAEHIREEHEYVKKTVSGQ